MRALGAKLHSIAHPIAAQLVQSERTSIESVQGLLDLWREQETPDFDTLQTYAKAWATCISQSPSHPLLMQVELESTTAKSQSVALAASLALVAAGGCGLWHWHTQKLLATTTEAIEQFEKQQSNREATEAAIKSAEASVVQLRKDVNKTETNRLVAERQIQLARAVHSLHNRRWLALVDALSESANEDCWVQKLESSSTQTVVLGLAIDNAAANGFAGRLELALGGSGWRTAPAATSLSSQNLIAFKIVLKATGQHDDELVNSGIALKQGVSNATMELAGGIAP